jgi:drug/metabolite transporter (DMT)-like permease
LAGTILTSVAGQFLLHHGLGFTGAIQGSITCAATVVSTAAFEALFLGQTLGPHALVGAALFVSAVALVATRPAAWRKSGAMEARALRDRSGQRSS